MKQATKRALLKSIEKWEAIVNGEGGDRSADDCALCKRFILYGCRLPGAQSTELCPVREKSGKTYCNGTPYKGFSRHSKWNKALKGNTPFGRWGWYYARKELEFLQSLLPEEE